MEETLKAAEAYKEAAEKLIAFYEIIHEQLKAVNNALEVQIKAKDLIIENMERLLEAQKPREEEVL